MPVKLQIKSYNELSRDELYEILKLRVNVFVVEQKCPYREIDDLDKEALHSWFEDEVGEIKAYLRVLDSGVVSEHTAIGRVIAVKRRAGLGTEILREGIRAARERFHADAVYVEAQSYARGLYEKQGFRQITEEFLEDGIPHIGMLLEI